MSHKYADADGGVHLQKLGQDLQSSVPNGRDLVKVIDTLGMLVQNPLMHPKNLKYRQVYDRSMTFKRRIKPYTAALSFLETAGFKRNAKDGAFSLGQGALTPNQRHVLQQALHVLEKLRDEAVQATEAKETPDQIESFKRKPIQQWSTHDCKHFLDNIGLARYAHALESHKIDGNKITEMDSRTLASYLGMGNNAHIRQLEESINRFRGGTPPVDLTQRSQNSTGSSSSQTRGERRDPLQGLGKIVQRMKETIEQERRAQIDLPTMQSRFEALKRELEEIKRPFDAYQKRLRLDIQRDYNRIDSTKKSLEDLGKAKSDIARQTNAIQRERNELKDTVTKLEAQIAALQRTLNQHKARDMELARKEQDVHSTRSSSGDTERKREDLRKLETEVKTLQSMQHVSNKQWSTALGYCENIKSTIETKKETWTQNWTLWTYRDIVAWICQIENGRFQRYQDILKRKLAELDVRGKKIQSLNGLVLQSFGILSGADCQSIEAAITLLTSQEDKTKVEIARKATMRRQAALDEQQTAMETEMEKINNQKGQIAAEWRALRDEKERQARVLKRDREKAAAVGGKRDASKPMASNTKASQKDAELQKAMRLREAEEAERKRKAQEMESIEDELRNDCERRVTEWVIKSGKFLLHHGDIRVMLNSMHDIYPHFDNPDKFGVNKSTAELKDVKKQYFKVSRLLHPDRHINSEPNLRVLASCVFTSVSDAYERFNKCYGGE